MVELIYLALLGNIPYFILFSIALLFSRWIYIDIKRARYIKDFTKYINVLDYYMEKSYDMIYKDRVLTYSLEALKPNESEIDGIVQDYVILVQKFLGPMLQKELIFMYGDRETFIRNIIEYFNSKFEYDKVREASLEDVTNTNIEDK